MAHSPRTPPASASLEASAPSTVPDPVEPGSDRLPFRRVPGKEYGYHLGQVEEFMDRARTAYEQGQGLTARDVRHTVFDAVRGGYAAAEIDEVLDRLEDTLALAERDRDIASLGVHTWAKSRRTEREVLLGRLDRSPGRGSAAPPRRRPPPMILPRWMPCAIASPWPWGCLPAPQASSRGVAVQWPWTMFDVPCSRPLRVSPVTTRRRWMPTWTP